jgi:hypothetical protein
MGTSKRFIYANVVPENWSITDFQMRIVYDLGDGVDRFTATKHAA